MKLVKEHINFERGLNPKDAMNIGLEVKLKEFIKDHGLESVARKWLVSYASGGERVDLVEYLLNNGADPNFHNGSPVNLAAIKGNLKIIELLAKHKANLDIDNGRALLSAMNNDHPDAFELLLKLGANPNEGFVFQNASMHDLIYHQLIKKYNKGW